MPWLKGGSVSLDDIENGTLRADFREPRIHFALVCASRSAAPRQSRRNDEVGNHLRWGDSIHAPIAIGLREV